MSQKKGSLTELLKTVLKTLFTPTTNDLRRTKIASDEYFSEYFSDALEAGMNLVE